MRRLGLIAAFLLFLCVPARASVLLVPGSATSVNQDSVTTATINVSPHVDGQLLVWFTSLANGATPSVTGGGWTCTTQTGTYSGTICTRTASSEPASYTMTWSGSTSVGMMMLTVERSDGATPTIDQSSIVVTASASSVNMPQVTTTGSGDLLLYFGSAFNGSAGATSFTQPGAVPFANAQFYRVIAGFLGQAAPGLTNGSINATAASTAAYVGATIAFNGAGSAVFVGHSGDVTGSTSVSPTFPLNSAGGDGAVVVIGGRGTTGYTVTPPLDFEIPVQIENNPATGFTIPSSVQVGDLALVWFTSYDTGGFTISPPSGWTPIQTEVGSSSHTAMGVWERTMTSGDTGGSTSYTWSISPSDNMAMFVAFLRSFSGATLSIDTSAAPVAPAGSSGNFPTVTTSGNNEWVFYGIGQTASVPTLGSGITKLTSHGTGLQVGETPQATAGLSATQTYSGGSGTGTLITFAVKSSNPTSPCTHIGSTVDPTDAVQLDAFQIGNIRAGLGGASLPFTSSASSSLVADLTEWGNVNATTPVDTSCFFSIPGGQYGNIPSCTPSSNDELFFGVQTHHNLGAEVVGVFAPLIGILSSPDIEDGYGPSNLTGPSYTSGFNAPYASVKLGIEAANTPARGTTNLRLNQEFLMLFSQYPIGQCNGCGGIGVTTP